jgi:hypothetical protein
MADHEEQRRITQYAYTFSISWFCSSALYWGSGNLHLIGETNCGHSLAMKIISHHVATYL